MSTVDAALIMVQVVEGACLIGLVVLVLLLRRRVAFLEGLVPTEYATYADPAIKPPSGYEEASDDVEEHMTSFSVPGEGLDEGGY